MSVFSQCPLENGILLFLVSVRILCKPDEANPGCLHQPGYLEAFDLNKEFILCIYGDNYKR